MNRFRKDHQEGTQGGPDKRPQPMREFKRSASGSSGSQRSRRMKKISYWLLPAFVFCLILALGAFLVFYFYTKEVDKGEGGSVADTTYAMPSEKMDAPELLDAYLKAMGGREALERVRSVRYDGRVILESSEQQFQMLLSLPDKGMLVTSPGEAQGMKVVLNGDTAWQVFEKRDGSRVVVPVDEPDVEPLKWSMRIHNSLRELALKGQSAGLSVSEVEYEGQPAFEVTKTMPDGSRFKATLDKEALYLVEIVETLSDEEGTNEYTVVYGDHRMVSGVVEPYTTKLYKNGNLENTVKVNSIQINSGVMSTLFEIPEEIKNKQDKQDDDS